MGIGRPRAFDLEEALDKALKVFWKKGYEGASLPDLTKAMGINRPSLYAAFGNKEALFRKALDRYTQKSLSVTHEILNETPARSAVEKLLLHIIEASVSPENPRGCLLVQGALSCGDAAESIRLELVERRGQIEILLRHRLERAHAENDLPADICPVDFARFIATVIQGMAVQTASGAGSDALTATARMALRAWPKI